MKKKVNELGATGKFPEGKLDDTDEGELRLMIGTQGGNVRIDFGKPVGWLALPKKDALAFSEAIKKYAENL